MFAFLRRWRARVRFLLRLTVGTRPATGGPGADWIRALEEDDSRGSAVPVIPNTHIATVEDVQLWYHPSRNSVDNGHVFQVKKGMYAQWFYVTKYPSQNCQVSSIGTLNTLLHIVNDRQTIQAVLKAAYRHIGRESNKLIFVDVHTQHIEAVERCFNVIWKNPYTSTNGTHMCAFMLRMD